jgi:ABC-type amino acid transport substrate-binding protein
MKEFLKTAIVFVLAAIGQNSAGAATVRAEETNQIKQLAVEEAKRLAQDKSGRLLLNGLTSLSAGPAKELAKHDGWLSLNGLTSLSDEAAAALGTHARYLHLNGLTTISDQAATELAGHRGELSLNSLTSISDESAKALARHSGGRLLLNGLTTLSAEAAKALAQRKGGGPTFEVSLDGLTTLSPAAAAAFVETHPHDWQGRLPGIKTVSVDLAKTLAMRKHGLSLGGLTTISDEAAKVLKTKLNGRLPELKTLSPEVAKVLAQTRGHLVLNSLTTLSDEAARALTEDAQNRGDLYLGGLTTLTPDTARAICRREGDLYLNGLTTISDEVLEALAEHKAHPHLAKPFVYFNGLTTISDEGAAVLASWPKWSGQLPALPAISEKSAAAFASSRNFSGKLPAVKTLSVEVARALARRNGNLSLDGLTTISDEVAVALAEHHGGTLSLRGLKSLSEKAAKALAGHDGRLSLGGLATISGGAAKALAAYQGDWLLLDGLTSLSIDAARSLAQRQGVVSAVGLKTLSDEAVKALRANPNVVLPEKFRATIVARGAVAVDGKFVRSFLDSHCADCHGGGEKEGDFVLERLARDDVAGRVAYASMLERLRAGDMPPASEERPDAAAIGKVVHWIAAKLDTPLAGPPAYYAVKDKPVDGNRLPNAILFGGPRGPSVPPPPRLWRLSPRAYSNWAANEFNVHGLQQPFGLIQDAGFKDFAALYAPDEGASGLLLTNAEQIVAAQVRYHQLVNVIKDSEAAKQSHWPDEARAQTATAEEREQLKGGVRVRGSGRFVPLLHPHVKANRDELERALGQQFKMSVARPPSEKELESLIALYEEVARDGDCALAGKTILMAPLMVPEAILRFEIGLGSEVRRGVRMLSPREIAMALSLAFSTKREPSLLAAAAQGKLTTREEVAQSVQQILDNPRIGKPRVMGFFREYFDYYRAPEVFKDPLPNHRTRRGVHYNARGLVSDTDVLVWAILSRDRDVLKELLTTSESYRSHELFHVSGGMDGLRYAGSPMFRQLSPVALEHRRPQQGGRIGILMQPSWQVAWSTNFHNDIVRRGRWVREHLLGGRVPDLQIDAAAMIPDDPHHTLRQRQMATRDAKCWKCHNKMDQLGLPFEDVNHYGYPRKAEQVLDLEAMEKSQDKNAKIYRDAPLDTTGLIAFSGDPRLDGPVRDAPEMLRRLAQSDRVRQVFIRHVFRYYLGRNETPGDAVSLQEAEQAYLESVGSFKALLVSLLSSESFLYRTLPTPAKESK